MSRFGNLEFDTQDQLDTPETRVERDESYWFSSAEDAFSQGDFETALRLYARVLEHNPNSVAAWTGQVRALVELGEFREARIWADKALERFPTAPELLRVAAILLPRDEIEDAVHDTFVVAMTRKQAWDEQRPLLPWLLGVLANEARSRRRRRRQQQRVAPVVDPSPMDPVAAGLPLPDVHKRPGRTNPRVTATVYSQSLTGQSDRGARAWEDFQKQGRESGSRFQMTQSSGHPAP